ncbi:hypothetical protein GEZ85_03035 [Streptococcus mitis]|uniref:Uncharacterized protein n=1 Tax=Streptococcus mitis TaxID=28037 RepID=A0A6I1UH91_STRMT|nr:hypothetical protein [Streptococcus mitis]MQQ40455.1 hypothetical protein [Streptococcus mitis]MQQ61491.1 hypothetical protein [Streptococcus mitis]
MSKTFLSSIALQRCLVCTPYTDKIPLRVAYLEQFWGFCVFVIHYEIVPFIIPKLAQYLSVFQFHFLVHIVAFILNLWCIFYPSSRKTTTNKDKSIKQHHSNSQEFKDFIICIIVFHVSIFLFFLFCVFLNPKGEKYSLIPLDH